MRITRAGSIILAALALAACGGEKDDSRDKVEEKPAPQVPAQPKGPVFNLASRSLMDHRVDSGLNLVDYAKAPKDLKGVIRTSRYSSTALVGTLPGTKAISPNDSLATIIEKLDRAKSPVLTGLDDDGFSYALIGAGSGALLMGPHPLYARPNRTWHPAKPDYEKLEDDEIEHPEDALMVIMAPQATPSLSEWQSWIRDAEKGNLARTISYKGEAYADSGRLQKGARAISRGRFNYEFNLKTMTGRGRITGLGRIAMDGKSRKVGNIYLDNTRIGVVTMGPRVFPDKFVGGVGRAELNYHGGEKIIRNYAVSFPGYLPANVIGVVMDHAGDARIGMTGEASKEIYKKPSKKK